MSDSPAGSAATLHGSTVHYLDAGSGPPVVLIHGLLSSHRSWLRLADQLAAERRIVAPDLLGHGASAKPMGDYSLSSHAAIVRDLLDHLDISSATLIGHSFGGGIALQFAYLFPDRVERLVLVSSGGLGRQLSLLLRAATLPGAEWVLPLLASGWVREHCEAAGRALGRLGVHVGPDIAEGWQGFVSLGDAESRRAFLATVRTVIDLGGQTVDAGPRLYLVARMPTLLVWGARDRVIPSWHAVMAQQAIPRSRLEVFERAGHFPHLDEPDRFFRVLRDFIAETS